MVEANKVSFIRKKHDKHVEYNRGDVYWKFLPFLFYNDQNWEPMYPEFQLMTPEEVAAEDAAEEAAAQEFLRQMMDAYMKKKSAEEKGKAEEEANS